MANPPGFPQVMGAVAGWTFNGTNQLPLLIAANTDGFTGTLQVGVIGAVGPVTIAGPIPFPYGTAAGEAAAATSFLGAAGFNGTTVDPFLTINGGQQRVTLYDAAGDTSNFVPNGADAVSNTGIAGLNTFGFLMGFNGTTWDRLRSNASEHLVVATEAVGVGALFEVPAGTTNGTIIGAQPAGSQGVRIYVAPGVNFTYTIAPSQPTAPANVINYNNPSTNQFPVVIDENLNGQNLYVTTPTSVTLGLQARWI